MLEILGKPLNEPVAVAAKLIGGHIAERCIV